MGTVTATAKAKVCMQKKKKKPKQTENNKIWQGYREIGNLNIIAAAKSLQSCSTLCDPRNGSLPDSSVPGILPARTVLVGM